MVEVHKDVSFKHPFWFECLRVFVQVLVVAGFWVWVLGLGLGLGPGSGFGSWVLSNPLQEVFLIFRGQAEIFKSLTVFFKNKNRKLLRSMI